MASPVTEIQFDPATFDVTDLGGGVVRIVGVGGGGYTDEQAQDAVGLILVDTSTIDFVYDDATPQITAAVKTDSITDSLLRNSAEYSVIGKTGAGIGDPADIVAADETVLGRTAAGNLVFAQVATGQVANSAITFAKVQNIATARVLGRTTAGAGVVEELSAGAGISIAGGSIASSITQYTDELAQDAVGAMVGVSLVYVDATPLLARAALTGDVTAPQNDNATTIANDAVTNAKLANVNSGTIKGRITAAAGDPEDLTPAQARSVADVDWSKAITVEQPTNVEDISMFFTEDAITITKMAAVLTGSATPSVTWTIRHSTDRSAVGNEVVTGGTTTTSTTTGSIVTVFNDATIPAASFVWLETTAQSGTVDSLNVTLQYTKD